MIKNVNGGGKKLVTILPYYSDTSTNTDIMHNHLKVW